VGSKGAARSLAAFACLLTAACAGFPANLPYTAPDHAAYRCAEGGGFEVRFAEDGVRLLWDGRSADLRPARSASGARYVSEDGAIVYWDKGGRARFEIGSEVYSDCRGQTAAGPWHAAAIRGADIRASGNEPPWILEIDAERRTILRLDYDRRILNGPPPAGIAADTLSLDIDGGARLRLTRESCRDTMSGEVSVLTAELRFEGRAYRGCARRLRDPF
jgi:membrane-bound inhibitor of C-type lysozyme